MKLKLGMTHVKSCLKKYIKLAPIYKLHNSETMHLVAYYRLLCLCLCVDHLRIDIMVVCALGCPARTKFGVGFTALHQS